MSQHLINDFIHRAYLFKPIVGGKINSEKVVKSQGSNRNNNASPQDFAESIYVLKAPVPSVNSNPKEKNNPKSNLPEEKPNNEKHSDTEQTISSEDKQDDNKHIDILV
jgi:hypothetical protein